MIFKINELIQFNISSQKIFNEKLPLTLAYKVAKIQRAIAADIEFYQKRYKEIITEYGDKDENGNLKTSEDGTLILMVPENREKAQAEITQLEEKEVDVPIDEYLLSLSDFNQDKMVSMEELSGLLPFIK